MKIQNKFKTIAGNAAAAARLTEVNEGPHFLAPLAFHLQAAQVSGWGGGLARLLSLIGCGAGGGRVPALHHRRTETPTHPLIRTLEGC